MKTPDDAKKKYVASTAQIIADNGNIMKADIMDIGEKYAEHLFSLRDTMRQDYWTLHNAIASHSFAIGDQTPAVAKLGQLALALEALETAYSKASLVRSFS